MKMYLTLGSESLKDNADALAEAIRCSALMENERGEVELLLTRLSDRLLELFILGHISGVDPEHYEEKITPLDGGLRIEEAGEVIEHQCCSEFDDYKCWEFILERQDSSWSEIWIGHPWIYYRIDGPLIYLSDYCELTPISMVFRFAFDKETFFAMLRARLYEAQIFKRRLQKLVQQGSFQNKEGLLNSLVHLQL